MEIIKRDALTRDVETSPEAELLVKRLLTPEEVATVSGANGYCQGGTDYSQWGGNYNQTGGNYFQTGGTYYMRCPSVQEMDGGGG